MVRFGRVAEILLGVSFVTAAFLKALDLNAFAIQIRFYGVLYDPTWLQLAAWSTVIAETALGIALLAGIRLHGATLALTFAILVGFTGLIAYAWAFKGLSNCGCFGKYVTLTPGLAITKNGIMLLLASIAGLGLRRSLPISDFPNRFRNPPRAIKAACGGLSIALVGSALALSSATKPAASPHPPVQVANPGSRPFAQFVFAFQGRSYDLGHGDYLVAMLSATCDRCMATVPALNNYALFPELPPLVALMLGEPQELKTFRAETRPDFPTVLTKEITKSDLTFFQLIGAEPPRIYLIRNGRELAHWDGKAPSPQAIRVALRNARPKSGMRPARQQ